MRSGAFVWSVLRYYKRDKLGAAVGQSVKRRVGGWHEMAASLGVSQLWDICQLVRMLAEDTVRHCYQKTTSEDIENFMCAAVTVILRVCKPVRLL
jgi:hypothetical protein